MLDKFLQTVPARTLLDLDVTVLLNSANERSFWQTPEFVSV